MSANSVPKFPDSFRVAMGFISAANTNIDGSGTIVTVCTAGTNGTLITNVLVRGLEAVTNGMVRLYIHDGSTARLLKEISVTATTPSGTVASFAAEYTPTVPLVLQSGYSLRASTHVAEDFVVIAQAGDY